MKKIFVLLCATVFALTASAQVTWNVKAGIGSAWNVINAPSGSSKPHIVGKLGVGIETPLSNNLSFMPSLEFAIKGSKRESKWGDASLSEKLNLTYIQLPIMAAYRFNATNRINVVAKLGPYFAYALSGKVKTTYIEGEHAYIEGGFEDGDYDFFKDNEGRKRFDAGLIIGVDFEFNRFVAGLEYERAFTNYFEDNEYGVKIKNSAAYITVGYKF